MQLYTLMVLPDMVRLKMWSQRLSRLLIHGSDTGQRWQEWTCPVDSAESSSKRNVSHGPDMRSLSTWPGNCGTLTGVGWQETRIPMSYHEGASKVMFVNVKLIGTPHTQRTCDSRLSSCQKSQSSQQSLLATPGVILVVPCNVALHLWNQTSIGLSNP